MRPLYLAPLLLVACSQNAGSGDVPPPATARGSDDAPLALAPSKTTGPILATVVTHEARVAIVGSRGRGLRVVVRDRAGELVADGVSLDELRARDPVLHALVTSAVAARAPGQPYIDATLDLPKDRPTR